MIVTATDDGDGCDGGCDATQCQPHKHRRSHTKKGRIRSFASDNKVCSPFPSASNLREKNDSLDLETLAPAAEHCGQTHHEKRTVFTARSSGKTAAVAAAAASQENCNSSSFYAESFSSWQRGRGRSIVQRKPLIKVHSLRLGAVSLSVGEFSCRSLQKNMFIQI